MKEDCKRSFALFLPPLMPELIPHLRSFNDTIFTLVYLARNFLKELIQNFYQKLSLMTDVKAKSYIQNLLLHK